MGPATSRFGLTLVGCIGNRKAIEDRPKLGFEFIQCCVAERLPVGCLDNGLTQEVVVEEASLECGVDAHPSRIHESARRVSMTP